ncbi:MAG: sialidase family protein [Mycobacteriales bacterium]
MQRIPQRMVVMAAVVSLGVAGLAPAAAAPNDGAGPKVVAAVQVTTDTNPIRAHSSPQMAMNPTNGELVIVSSEVRTDFGCLVHLSTDGGRTWSQGGVPMLEPWTECSGKAINGPYATAAFDQAGVLYVAFYANDPKYAAAANLPIHIFLARSTDGGRTFETNFVYRAPEPVVENEGLHNNDRPMVAVDQQDSENVYVSWMGRGAKGQKGTKALVAASSDGGRTFQEPVDVTDERGGYQARPAVTPDGTLHVIYPIGLDARPEGVEAMEVVRTVYHRASKDNGATWSTPVEVDEGNAGFFGGRKYLLVADQEGGALHAVWSASEVPLFDPNEQDVDVFLRSSRDGGQTWEERVTVNDDADRDLVNHYDPGIAIAPDGRIDIAWYDFRNSPYPERFPAAFSAPFNHDGYQDVYYTWSIDGGRSFAPNLRVTDRIINREIGVWSNNVHSHMNVAMASTNDATYFAWQDSRNGDETNQAEDIYMTSALHTEDVAGGEQGAPWWAVVAVGGSTLLLGVGLALLGLSLSGRRRLAPTTA